MKVVDKEASCVQFNISYSVFLYLEPSLGILLKFSLCKFYYFKSPSGGTFGQLIASRQLFLAVKSIASFKYQIQSARELSCGILRLGSS